MGSRKKHAPRRGSLGVRPRKRASRVVPRVRSWPRLETEEVKLLGFAGYKVGMTHAIIVDDRPGSPTYGREVFVPVTVVETPPMILAGVRLYGYEPNRGLYTLTEAWAPKDSLEEALIHRHIKRFSPTDGRSIERLEQLIDAAKEVRVLMLTQPRLITGVPKKKPELIEIPLAGKDLKSKLDFAISRLGEPIKISDVFSAGMFIDVISITKGKGFQGVIKRFGVKELPRWHKHRKHSRTVGARGSRVGALSTTPQAGQTGFHQRVEYNKRILMIGMLSDGRNEEMRELMNPAGGWHKYGLVRSDFVVLAGSLPGPQKRLAVLRYPVRKTPWEPQGAPKIVFLNTGKWKVGVAV